MVEAIWTASLDDELLLLCDSRDAHSVRYVLYNWDLCILVLQDGLAIDVSCA